MAKAMRSFSLRARVVDALASAEGPLATMTLAIAAGAPIRRVTTTCNELVSMGALVRTQDGRVMLPPVYPPLPAPRRVSGPLVACLGLRLPRHASLRDSEPVACSG